MFRNNSLNVKDFPQIDYSNCDLKYDFFGYSSVSDGKYRIDDKHYDVKESFLTEKYFKLYKDCGMTIMFPQVKISIEKDDASVERAKHYVDMFVKCGIDRTILFDGQISSLSKTVGPIVGEGYRFKDYDELDEFIYSSVKRYAGYPGIYGIMLGDEPFYTHLEAYSDVYNSLKRVKEKYNISLFVQYNLNPFCDYRDTINKIAEPIEPHETQFLTHRQQYKNYVNSFLDRMKPDHIQFDTYPFRNHFMNKTYFPSFEVMAEIAKERNIKLFTISQTFSMLSDGNLCYRKLNEQELRYLNNIQLAFGVKQVGYFTFFTKADNDTHGEFFIDNGSFINRHGKVTKVYNWMKQIFKENQQIANITLNFDYNTRQLYTMYPMDYDTFHLQFIEKDGVMTKLKDFSTDSNALYVTELIDKKRNNYMYSFMNVVDPRIKSKKATLKAKFEFDTDEYKHVCIIHNGNTEYYDIPDGKGEMVLKPGEACLVLPF